MNQPNAPQTEIVANAIYQDPQVKANLEARRQLNENFIKSLIRVPETKKPSK